ncbi:MAG: YciI family protein [Betaproteobacteria bacterium]|nr:YciI family protein [Betaproteobacteria bacterium]
MQYMMLICETEDDFKARTNEKKEMFWAAWRAYHEAMVGAGVYITGSALQAPSTGTTVRLKGGKRLVQDGPFADTKEQLGGFIILELPSLDAALDWAARCPAAATGAVEVRPVLAM